MGAVKAFYLDCAEAGRCPVSRETWDYLDEIECQKQLDWIEYAEHDYRTIDGTLAVHDCITMESAHRLVAEGLANEEIVQFVESFGDCCRPCDGCGRAKPITLVSRWGERFCGECH